MGLNRFISKYSEIVFPPVLENDLGINGFAMPLS